MIIYFIFVNIYIELSVSVSIAIRSSSQYHDQNTALLQLAQVLQSKPGQVLSGGSDRTKRWNKLVLLCGE